MPHWTSGEEAAIDVVLRLIGGPVPSGQIRALDASRILAALHEMSIRLERQRSDMTGVGRSKRGVEELGEVRLVALGEGSTEVTLEVGPSDVLDIEIDEERWLETELARILEGMADDARPGGLSDLVADAAGDLVRALRTCAREVEMSVGTRPPRRVRTEHLHRETWTSAVCDRGGDLKGVADPAITPCVRPSGISIGSQSGTPLAELLGSVPGPDPEGAVDLTVDELAEFMKAIER